MNAKIFSCGLLMGFVLVSCQPSAPQSKPKSADKNPGPPAIDQITLEKRADGLFYQTGTDKPFTGSDIEPDIKKAKEENRNGFVVVTPYKDGRIHGTMKIFYPTGDLQEERVYEEGAPKESTIYYTKLAKKTYVKINAKGVAEGPYTRWHPNGKLHTEGVFDENEKFHGEFKKFDEAGTLTAHYTMDHGKIATVHAESPAQKEERLKKSGSTGNPVP